MSVPAPQLLARREDDEGRTGKHFQQRQHFEVRCVPQVRPPVPDQEQRREDVLHHLGVLRPCSEARFDVQYGLGHERRIVARRRYWVARLLGCLPAGSRSPARQVPLAARPTRHPSCGLPGSMPRPAPPGGVRRALDQEELVLFYQPIHETQSRRIVAAEALLRARRSNGEVRSAASIAEGAEELPDLFRLDSWLVRTSYADAEAWQRDGASDVRLNVNLSPRELEEGNLAERLTGIAPKLSLEITETRRITLPEETRDTLQRLKAGGVEIWLDDFGTGHSSVEHLLFPIDGIKLPAQFVGQV